MNNKSRDASPASIPPQLGALLGIGLSKTQAITRRLIIGSVIAVLLFLRFATHVPSHSNCPAPTRNVAVERMLTKQSLASARAEALGFLRSHPAVRTIALCNEPRGAIVATIPNPVKEQTKKSDTEVLYDLMKKAAQSQKH